LFKMKFINAPNIETTRLQLNKIEQHHIDIIFKLRSNAIVGKYIARPLYKARNEARLHIDKVINQQKSNATVAWVIDLKIENSAVGTICLWNFSEDRKTAEIGYDLLPEYFGKGIMSEAMDNVLDFGFKTLKLNTIEAFTQYENLASINLLKKKGFKHQPDRSDPGFPKNSIYIIYR